jgi:hypothetical protein
MLLLNTASSTAKQAVEDGVETEKGNKPRVRMASTTTKKQTEQNMVQLSLPPEDEARSRERRDVDNGEEEEEEEENNIDYVHGSLGMVPMDD